MMLQAYLSSLHHNSIVFPSLLKVYKNFLFYKISIFGTNKKNSVFRAGCRKKKKKLQQFGVDFPIHEIYNLLDMVNDYSYQS